MGGRRSSCDTGEMSTQRVTVSRAENDDEIMEFWLFANEVYAVRPAHWRTNSDDVNPLLKGEGPAAEGRTTAAFVARSGRRTVARAAAMVDEHYIARWKEPLGHVVLFEALPGTTEAVRALMDEACGWLRGRGPGSRSEWMVRFRG